MRCFGGCSRLSRGSLAPNAPLRLRRLSFYPVGTMRMTLVIVAGLVAGALPVVSGASPASTVPLVDCGQIIGGMYSAPRVKNGSKIVLDSVAVIPHIAQPPVAVTAAPWTHWLKSPLIMRSGKQQIEVSVPKAWRNRAAVTWGNSGIVSALRVAPCPSLTDGWHVYAGGFYLRSRSACVPLVIRMGMRTTTVRFGIGRSCG
jgi:hypothetical protein